MAAQAAAEGDGKVLAPELATRLNASEDTARRDLRDLDHAGPLRRAHGVTLRRTTGEAPLQQRAERDGTRKAALGLALRSLFQRHDTVLIDAGSPNLALVNKRIDGCAAAIVTNSPQVAPAPRGFQRMRFVLIGGGYSPACGAALAPRPCPRPGTSMHLCIVSVCAVDAQKGLYAADRKKPCSGERCWRHRAAAPLAFAALAELEHSVHEADAPPDVLPRLRDTADGPDILLARTCTKVRSVLFLPRTV